MKKAKFLCLLFVGLSVLSSCSKDDNNTSSSENSFPGNNLGTGQSAHDLLANDQFSKLHVEAVYAEGFQPTNQALENLQSFIEAHTQKNNVTVDLREINAPSGAPYSISEVKSVEDSVRQTFNTENTISVFVFFANGSSSKDEGDNVTLGTTYKNTSVVIFEKSIRDLTASPLAPNRSSVETTSLNHEFGHLFGLVDIGSPAQSDHVDPDSSGHCTTEGCLMQAKAEFGSGVMGMLGNGIPDLQADCIADLVANGGK